MRGRRGCGRAATLDVESRSTRETWMTSLAVPPDNSPNAMRVASTASRAVSARRMSAADRIRISVGLPNRRSVARSHQWTVCCSRVLSIVRDSLALITTRASSETGRPAGRRRPSSRQPGCRWSRRSRAFRVLQARLVDCPAVRMQKPDGIPDARLDRPGLAIRRPLAGAAAGGDRVGGRDSGARSGHQHRRARRRLRGALAPAALPRRRPADHDRRGVRRGRSGASCRIRPD